MPEAKAEHTKRLVEAIRLLAMDAETQFSLLPDFVCVPDELATTFCDAFDVIGRYLPEIWGNEVTSLCQALYTTFDQMTSEAPEEFFSDDAVRHDQRWQNVREQAKTILSKVNLPPATPALHWITYVGSHRQQSHPAFQVLTRLFRRLWRRIWHQA